MFKIQENSNIITIESPSDNIYVINWGIHEILGDQYQYETKTYEGEFNENVFEHEFINKAQLKFSLKEVSDVYKFIKNPDYVWRMQRYLKRTILDFDSSSDINTFYLGEEELWLDKATRVGLKLRFESELKFGKTETTLWQNGKSYTLPLETAIELLSQIELYASKCYDNTQQHLANVENLFSEDDFINYDYKSGYPDKLRF